MCVVRCVCLLIQNVSLSAGGHIFCFGFFVSVCFRVLCVNASVVLGAVKQINKRPTNIICSVLVNIKSVFACAHH